MGAYWDIPSVLQVGREKKGIYRRDATPRDSRSSFLGVLARIPR
jgi:hypothetical protein